MATPAATALAELSALLEPLTYEQLLEVLENVTEYRFNLPRPHVVRVVQNGKPQRWLGRTNILLDTPDGAVCFGSERAAYEAGIAIENLAYALNGVVLLTAAVPA